MDAEAEAVLLAHDCESREEWEQPENWTHQAYAEALKRVKQLRQVLEEKVGVLVSLDDGYQDASCFADVTFESDGSWQILRFSNFDNLVVAFKWVSDTSRQIQPSNEQKLLDELLREFGFTPLPPESLNQLYSGKARDWWHYDDKNFTWFNRFFDYL